MPRTNSTNFSETEGAKPIAFLDSGVGGLPYLEMAREHLPKENFIYLADRKNFPYGTKSAEEVFAAVAVLTDRILAAEKPKVFVLACNTMSVVALTRLRKLYPRLPFVGVVPAVKPAAERTKVKRIGVLATNRTLQDAYLDDLIRRFASSCEVVRVAGPGNRGIRGDETLPLDRGGAPGRHRRSRANFQGEGRGQGRPGLHSFPLRPGGASPGARRRG